MIPKIHKILYTTDLSKNSLYAFRYAMDSARQHDAQIHILHVIELHPQFIDMAVLGGADPEKLYESHEMLKEAMRRKIEERINNFAKRELKDDPTMMKRIIGIHVVDGDPASEILKEVDELGCDMVIMGANGKGITAHTFLGNVSERVLRRIRKPVYIIPLPEKGSFMTENEI